MARFSHKLVDRADRLDQHHLRRHQRLHRADPGQHLHPQDAVGRVLGAQSVIWQPSSRRKDADTPAVWQSILEHEGSVAHLDMLDEREKAVFRTAFEIDQRWVVDLAADRAPYICQSQSINLYLPADIDKWDLHMLHWTAWERGMKSLYYCRSKSISRAGFAGKLAGNEAAPVAMQAAARTDYEECLACQ